MQTFINTSGTVAHTPSLVPAEPTRLTSLVQVKHFLSINPSNTRWDCNLKDIVELVSQQVEQECDRSFLKATVEEFHPSQIDPQLLFEDAEYLWMHRPPVDQSLEIDLRFSYNRDWDNQVNLFTTNEALIKPVSKSVGQSEVILIYRKSHSPILSPLPYTFTPYDFEQWPHEVGYRLRYTGGFPLIPDSGDTLDNSNFVNVPHGLQAFVAHKTALAFQNKLQSPIFLTDDDKKALRPWRRQGRILGS